MSCVPGATVQQYHCGVLYQDNKQCSVGCECPASGRCCSPNVVIEVAATLLVLGVGVALIFAVVVCCMRRRRALNSTAVSEATIPFKHSDFQIAPGPGCGHWERLASPPPAPSDPAPRASPPRPAAETET